MTALLLAASCVGALQASLLWQSSNDCYDTVDIATDGSVAYVATGYPDGVLAVDMSDPRLPTVLGACGDMVTEKLALSRSMVYAVGSSENPGMVCDVSTPSSPVVVGSFALPAKCRNFYFCTPFIAAAGTNVYLLVRDNYDVQTVYFYDVANSLSPTQVSEYKVGQGEYHMKASKQYLYLMGDNGLQILDAANPRIPVLVGSYLAASAPLVVSSTMLYSACTWDNEQGICVLDVSDPTAPTLVGSLNISCEGYMALSGTVLYTVLDESNTLAVVDVSDPVLPAMVGSLYYHYGIKDVASLGTTTVLTAGYDSPLCVADVSVPSEPTLIGTYGGRSKCNTTGVYVEGPVAVVSEDNNGDSGGTLTIYNVSNPSAATQLSVMYFSSVVYKAVIVGQYVYAGYGDGLGIVNISNPFDPSVLYFGGEAGTGAYSVWTDGQLAYLPYSRGLHIVDVSDPTNPDIIGTFRNWPPRDVTVVGTTAYIVGPAFGLVTVDVSYPSDPREMGSVYTPGTACGVCVSGGVAYVAAGSGGLHVVDVSNAEAPTILGHHDTGDARKVRVEGGLVYVADAKSGLSIFDVSDPTTPVLLDTAATNGVARDVYAVGTKVYVAARGLRIFDVSEATPLPTTSVPRTVAPSPTTSVPGTVAPSPSTQSPYTLVPETTMQPSPAPVPTPDAPGKDKEHIPSWVWAVVVLGALGVLGGAAVAYYVLRTKAANVSDHHDYVAQPGVLNEELVDQPAV